MGLLSLVLAGLSNQHTGHLNAASNRPRPRRFPLALLGKEILTAIFTYASASSAEQRSGVVDKFSPFDRRASPMNISQVCRQWRKYALSLPHLWTTIYLWDLYPRSPDLLRLWIQRSKSELLRISLATMPFCRRSRPDYLSTPCYCDRPCPIHRDPRVMGLLSLIVEHSARWEKIVLSMYPDGPTPLLRLTNDSFPRLQAVGFRCDSLFDILAPDAKAISRKTRERFWEAARLSPALNTLCSLGALAPNWPLDRFQHITFIDRPTYMDVSPLKSCRNLISLTFKDPLPFLTDTIPLPTLRHLQVVNRKYLDGLPPFTTPSLQSLRLTVDGMLSRYIRSLNNFLTTSSCNLEELTLVCIYPRSIDAEEAARDQETILQFFTETSLAKLTSLTLESFSCPTSFVDFFAHPNETCLPSLQHLNVQLQKGARLSDFVSMIEARRESDVVQNLKSVRLGIPSKDTFWVENRAQPGSTIALGDCDLKFRTLGKQYVAALY